MTQHARDEAGNIWEIDAAGNPVRLVQPAGQAGQGMTVAPNPAKVAEHQRIEARQNAADQRAAEANARAANAEARAQAKFEMEDTVVPTPGDMTKTGDDYLATLDPGLAGQVRALAEGRRAFPTGTALKDPSIRELIAAATQYDPTLDAANAATRVATRRDFTSGPTARNITSLNTALGHLGSLWNAAQELDNSGFPWWNRIANATANQTGNAKVQGALKDFNVARDAAATELMRAFRGGTGTGSVQEINDWQATINSADSPAALRHAIGKGIELLQSRLQSLGDQYQRGMGQSKDPVTLLSPHAQQVYMHLQPGGDGIVPGTTFGGGNPPGGGTPPGGRPDGSTTYYLNGDGGSAAVGLRCHRMEWRRKPIRLAKQQPSG